MGFTAASIVAPNVPDRLDPLTFLTAEPRSRVQEQAQEQARALGHAVLRGMSPREIEQIVLGTAASRKEGTVELTKEEIAEFQHQKTCTMPLQGGAAGPPPAFVEYPFLFVNNVRSRAAHSCMTVAVPPAGPPPRASNVPTIPLSAAEFARFDAGTIEKHADVIAERGLAKFVLGGADRVAVRVPFSPDATGFRLCNQYFVGSDTALDYRAVKRGFFRALIRFHTSYTNDKKRLVRFPTIDRRAVDFFRMFLIVAQRGGVDAVVKNKEWAHIGRELGYPNFHTLSTSMRSVYMRVVHPFAQWLAVHTDPAPHLIPQLDVVDETTQLGDGWKRLSYGIVVYARVGPARGERRVARENVQRSACLTLRSYTDLEPPKPVTELETEFKNLPEFFQTDCFAAPLKLYGLPPYVQPPTSEAHTDFGDISDWPLRGAGRTWPALIDADIDDLLLPELVAGRRFSVVEWQTPPAGTYHVSMIVDGSGATWNTVNGEIVDQFLGEIIVVAPQTKTMRWRHNFSMSVEANMFQPKWLTSVGDLPDLNVQKIVHNLCTAKGSIDENVKAQTLQALHQFRDSERQYGEAIKNRRVVKEMLDAPSYFSHVRVGDKVMKPSKYTGNESEPAELCTIYDSVDQYFADLEAQLLARPALPAAKWADAVAAALSHKDFPTRAEITTLEQSQDIPRPPRMPEAALEQELKQLVANLDKWLAEPAEQRLTTMRSLVEISDEKDVIRGFETSQSEQQKSRQSWSKMNAALENGMSVDRLLAVTTELLQDPETDHAGIAKVQRACCWVVEAIALARPNFYGNWSAKPALPVAFAPVVDEASAVDFRNEGIALGFKPSMQLMGAVDALIVTISESNRQLSVLLGTLEALDPVVVSEATRQLQPVARFLQPSLMAQLAKLHAHAPLLARMKDPDLWKRPRRHEVQVLSDIPALGIPLLELDNWLFFVKSLPWPAIFAQIQAMIAGQPALSVVPVSQTAVLNMYMQIFRLPVLPDDIEQVMKTFEKTLEHFKNQPAPMLQKYGFVE